MVVRCECVIYKENKLCFGLLVIKVKRVYIANSISYDMRTGKERLHQFLAAIAIWISGGVKSKL